MQPATNDLRLKTKASRLYHFEGLRGVAAFIVFLAHFRPTFCIHVNEQFLDGIGIDGINSRIIAESFINFFYEGTLPVYIFWFMSAYVISIKLFDLKKNANNRYLTEASTKRYLRLAIPVFASSIICFLLMKTNLMFNHQLAQQLGHLYSDAWLNNQYQFEPDISHFLRTSLVEVFMNGNCNYNYVLWTMNPELLGSFLCFALFAFVGRNKYRFIIYLVSGLFMLLGSIIDTHYFFYWAFLLGLMWCDVMNSADEGIVLKDKIRRLYNSKTMAISLLVISYAVPIFSQIVKPLHETLNYFFNYPLKAIAITLLINNFNILRNLFSIRLLTFLGKISFSLYLLHLPVLFSIGAYLYLYAGITSEYKILIIFLIVTAVLILVSYLFERIVDRKSINISNRIGKFFSSNDRND